jgi:electron transport complex protein RnfB
VDSNLADAIDALLPQTQCRKCGYPGCRPYAEAIARGKADINQCPPGGQRGIRTLAALLGREEKPLNPANGTEQPRAAAVIDESRCIGCMLCVHACPTDAIVGAAKQMHTVLTRYCTGCELCVPACPVDCIDMIAVAALAAQGDVEAHALCGQSLEDMAALARARFHARQQRLEREARERVQRMAGKAQATRDAASAPHDASRKQAAIQAALERARARRQASRT